MCIFPIEWLIFIVNHGKCKYRCTIIMKIEIRLSFKTLVQIIDSMQPWLLRIEILILLALIAILGALGRFKMYGYHLFFSSDTSPPKPHKNSTSWILGQEELRFRLQVTPLEV